MNNKLKYTINAVLLSIVVGSLAYAFLKPAPPNDPTSPTRTPLGDTIPIVEGVDPNFAVYFFYNDVYCDTCERLEGYAIEAVRAHFHEDLDSGVLRWRSIDMTTPENEHYAEDFKLFSKSIVLVELVQDEEIRWENLKDIWDLVYDQPKYTEYIKSSLAAFMGDSQ